METETLDLGIFFVKVSNVSILDIEFQFEYDSKAWHSLRIVFFASTRNDIVLGSVFTNFGSLKGDRALSRVRFEQPIPNYNTSIMRTFINGFSTNQLLDLSRPPQIQISMDG